MSVLSLSTLSGIFNIGQSGIQAAQTGIDAVSNNVANVNTTGYVREVVNQSSTAVGGAGTGVMVDSIARATNTYLEAASQQAQSDSSAAAAVSSTLSQAQQLFGDPSGTNSFFSQLDNVFNSFSTVAASPNAATQSAAVTATSTFLSSANTVNSGLQQLSSQTDQQIANDVTTVNGLLSQISALNSQISNANITGSDATGSENQQSSLIQQLSSLASITTTTGANGVVTVRAADGTLLADGRGAATLSYDSNGPTGQISITPNGGTPQSASNAITSGEISGLLSLRNVQLPGIQDQVSQLVTQAAAQLNAAANSYSSFPAPGTLTGANTGMDLTTDLNNFSGSTTIAIVNAAGVVQAQAQVSFTPPSANPATPEMISVNGGAPVTTDQFLSAVNGALGSSGSVSFANGVMSVSASGSGNGVVVSDSTTSPTAKGATGQGFSAFFGLNNLIQSSQITNFNTGLTPSDQSGFPAGQTISLRLSAADGSTLKNVTITTPSGSTMQDMLAALNNKGTGVGAYGVFNLSPTGQLSFQAAANSGVTLSVTGDGTQNAAGASLSALFGIGDAQQTTAASSYSVRADIADNPSLLQSSAVNLGAASGVPVIAGGASAGADALSRANQVTTSFAAAGSQGATTTTITNYASTLSGDVANSASNATTAATNAAAVATEAQSRLSGAEGVNIDTELVSLTTYQQAYSASARLIQAASDMFNTLLGMIPNG